MAAYYHLLYTVWYLHARQTAGKRLLIDVAQRDIKPVAAVGCLRKGDRFDVYFAG